MRAPAMTELMRFLRDGVTAAWAASGLERAAPAATVRAAGIASVCSLFSALQHTHDLVSLPGENPQRQAHNRPCSEVAPCGLSRPQILTLGKSICSGHASLPVAAVAAEPAPPLWLLERQTILAVI